MFAVEKIDNRTFQVRVDTELSDEQADDVATTLEVLMEEFLAPREGGYLASSLSDDLDDDVPF